MDPDAAGDAPGKSHYPACIVALGASAGGLDALKQFLQAVPAASGLAYVVVQHLDPLHKAMLVELLQRATPMAVREATEAMPIAADCVYVIPPNRELTVVAGALHLTTPLEPRGLRLPIDAFFNSLARYHRDRSVGVVLSGMGSDGTRGLQAIKSAGGLTLAQTPESAQFDSMPRSAIAAACVDVVALPAEMPKWIRVALENRGNPAVPALPADEENPQCLGRILDLLHAHCKRDLALYKPSTMRRRIERRMGVHGLRSMPQYEGFVRQNPQELDLLFKEMLIGVTSFFRDPAVWQALRETALPELLARHPAATRFRAWVIGCSTGEEAYSLAMVFREAVDALTEHTNHTLQIFASDLNADAIAAARRGRYPGQIAADVGPQRLARFFTADGEGFLIDKKIREMVLFAQHDVILDPPFTKVDILSCRNLIIYFTTKLQRRLVPLFHYCLRPGGILVLGKSETVGPWQAQFNLLDTKARIYRRHDNTPDIGVIDFPVHRLSSRPSAQESPVPPPPRQAANLQSLADQVLIQEFSPPAVLVNEDGDIVYISGRTGRYLEPAAGKANWNIHVMLRPEIRARVVGALVEAIAERKPVEIAGLLLEADPGRPLDVTVRSLQEPDALQGLVMIVFRDAPASAARPRRRRSRGAADPQTAEDVLRLQQEIRALRMEMGASREELQATNEELQSTNEELQSANEELTTSKEESQSMNEELQTINTELQNKLDELALAQSDMQNLLNSTDIATLFLDNDLNVRRFTDKITRIVHLRDSDIGRPLSDLASTLIYPDLTVDARETLRTLAFSEKQISTTDGLWFSVRIMPYRTLANVIQGAVITFVDITAAKVLESRLRKE
jgi:two-component system CheB/CheR fusion protein